MKKIVFTICLIVATNLMSFAQTEKGRWTAGVSVGNFEYRTSNNTRFFSTNLTPSAGYFVANNLLVGSGVPLGWSTTKSGSFYEATSSSIGVSPFVRYYVGASSLKPYAGVSYTYSQTNTQTQSPGNSNEVNVKYMYSSLAPTVGLAYFVNRNVALNAGLSYNFFNSTSRREYNVTPGSTPSETKTDYRSLTLNVGFQLFFGN